MTDDTHPSNILAAVCELVGLPGYDRQKMETVYNLIGFLSTNPELMTEDIRLSLLQIVQLGEVHHNINLLIYGNILGEMNPSAHRFLVNQLGANPNLRIHHHRYLSEVGAGILHYLAFSSTESEEEVTERNEKALLMIELGAQFDMKNDYGETPADWWLEHEDNEGKTKDDLPGWLKEGVPKLI